MLIPTTGVGLDFGSYVGPKKLYRSLKILAGSRLQPQLWQKKRLWVQSDDEQQ